MTSAHQIRLTPRMQKAVEELNLLINTRLRRQLLPLRRGLIPKASIWSRPWTLLTRTTSSLSSETGL
jgi:hypothetical protein